MLIHSMKNKKYATQYWLLIAKTSLVVKSRYVKTSMQISKEVIQKMFAMQNDLNLFSAYFRQFSLTLSSTVVFHSWLWISKTNFSAHYSRYKLRNLKCIFDFKCWHGKKFFFASPNSEKSCLVVKTIYQIGQRCNVSLHQAVVP